MRNKWPESFMKSFGRCEVCFGGNRHCNDTPSRMLPLPTPRVATMTPLSLVPQPATSVGVYVPQSEIVELLDFLNALGSPRPYTINNKTRMQERDGLIARLKGRMTAPLATEPKTRRTDPGTSREAAESAKPLRPSQEAVLFAAQSFPQGFTDEELISHYNGIGGHGNILKLPKQSDAGIRSRRKELVNAGKIYATEFKRRNTTGRACTVWKVVPS